MPASVSALTEVAALLIRKEDFRRVCLQQPEVALKALAKVGGRLRHLVVLVEQVTFGNVRQRLAQTLLEFQESAKSSISCCLKPTNNWLSAWEPFGR